MIRHLRSTWLWAVLALILHQPQQAQAQTSVPYSNDLWRFDLPAAWVLLDYGQVILIGDSQASLAVDGLLGNGQFRADLVLGDVGIAPYYLEAGSSAEEVFNQTLNFPLEDMCQPPREPLIDEASGLRSWWSVRACSESDQAVLVTDLPGDDVAVVLLTTPPQEAEALRAPLLALTRSAQRLPQPALEDLPRIEIDSSAPTRRLTSRNQTMTLSVPDVWLAEEDQTVENAFGITSGPRPFFPQPPQGQLSILMTVVQQDSLPRAYRSPEGVVLLYGAQGVGGAPYGAVQRFALDGRRAAQRPLETSDADAWIVALELPDQQGYALAQFIAPVGEYTMQGATLYALLASVRYDPAAYVAPPAPSHDLPAEGLTQTHTNGSAAFRLAYPSTWDVSTTLIDGAALSVLTPYEQETTFRLSVPERGRPFALISRSTRAIGLAPTPQLGENAAVVLLNFINRAAARPDTEAIEPFDLAGRQAARLRVDRGPFVQETWIIMIDDSAYFYVALFSQAAEIDSFSRALQVIMASAESLPK
ncbi:MAG: hypothetical protein NZ750_13725 [Anaerolineae bacterium]|nr:hypothetical protein [Anaerolineae bacterium]MDW8172859.1 hypothetical protein [Anaerolineae bacterium]